jgi:hypothetical protein
MRTTPSNGTLKKLITAYFSDPRKQLWLEKGETLMSQGDHNERLFLVIDGLIGGYVKTEKNGDKRIFTAGSNMFAGVYSFFSRTYESSMTVIAEEDSLLAYIERDEPFKDDGKSTSLFEQFMPVVTMDLTHRWNREQEVFFEKERTLTKLIQTEKLASLGQMAAGIAHELNNAISVLERNANWLREMLTPILNERYPNEIQFFASGGVEGRSISSRDVRARSKEIAREMRIPDSQARKLAETGLTLTEMKNIQKEGRDIFAAYRLWELGTAFYDMQVASRHASHVVRSVKNLAARGSRREQGFDINESIQEALTILSSPLRKVEVDLKLGELPAISANKGELVQVWMNLIKNASEAMLKARIENPALHIRSSVKKNFILVEVEDNGPGIPRAHLERIFQPDFTTKETGLEFGLGLGLSIVERIVNSYGGDVNVRSKPGKTVFVVRIRV